MTLPEFLQTVSTHLLFKFCRHVAQIGPQAEEEEMVDGLDERSVALRPFERKNLAR